MHKFARVLVVVSFLALAACTPPPDTTVAPASSLPARGATLRIATDSVDSIGDIPTLIVLDELKALGYTLELTQLGRSNLIPEVLLRGDADIGKIEAQSGWSAIASSPEIASIVGKSDLEWSIVAKAEIASCQDLDERSVGLGGTTGVTPVLFRLYVERHCPTARPQVVVLGNSEARMVALLKREVDVVQLDIDSWLALLRQDPSGFRQLVTYSEEFPDIMVSSFAVRRDWAASHPEVVKDFVRTYLLVVRRAYEDTAWLSAEIVKRLEMEPADAEASAQMALDQRVWDPNGGLTSQGIQTTLDFLVSAEAVPEGLTPRDVADLSYLNAVLDEIGRE